MTLQIYGGIAMLTNNQYYLSVIAIFDQEIKSATKFVQAVLAQITWYRSIALEDKIREGMIAS